MLGRLDFEGADVDGAVDDPREAGAALVGGQGLPVVGSTARALLPASMAGLPGKRAMVWVGPPLSASRWVEPRVGDADLVAVDAIDQAAGAAGADQVVRAGRGHRAGDVAGRCRAAWC